MEEPKPGKEREARTIDIGESSGISNQKGKKVSWGRWKHIKCWHLVEPSTRIEVPSDPVTVVATAKSVFAFLGDARGAILHSDW
eukprot:12509100-Ditylum_brightwellii.AAC.1